MKWSISVTSLTAIFPLQNQLNAEGVTPLAGTSEQTSMRIGPWVWNDPASFDAQLDLSAVWVP